MLLNSEGTVAHLILHAAREAFDELLAAFVNHRCGPVTSDLRFLLEMDLLNRPHVYRDTAVVEKTVAFEVIRVVAVVAGGYLVEIPSGYRRTAAQLVDQPEIADADRVMIGYRTTQLPFMPGKSLKENYAYCQDRLRRVRSLLSVWRAAA